MADSFTVKVKTLRGGGENSVDLSVSATTTVGELKAAIAESTLKVAPEHQRLIYQGRMLKEDTKTVGDHNLTAGSCVLLQDSSKALAAASPTSTTTSTPTPTHTHTHTTSTGSAGLSTSTSSSAGATAATATPRAPPPPPSTSATLPPNIVILRAAIAGVRTSNTPEVAETALRTLQTIFGNVIQNPHEAKYRSVKRSNGTFDRKVGSVSGTGAILRAAGFGESPDVWELTPSEQAWNNLCSTKAELDSVIAALPPPPSATPTTYTPTPTMPPMGGMGGMGGGGMDPNMMMAAMQQMQNNPAMRAQALQQIRQMNPAMAGQAEALFNNPGMLAQAAQMMQSNPNLMQQAQAMAGAGGNGGMGGMPNFGNFAAPPPPPSQAAPSPSPSPGGMDFSSLLGGGGVGGGVPTQAQAATHIQGQGGQQQQSDASMTEEELIQQAIERSLRET